jgi:ribosomal protein L29
MKKNSSLTDYKKMSLENLRKELQKNKEALYKIKFQKTVEEFKDVTQIRKMKCKIAQILTLITQKENEVAE